MLLGCVKHLFGVDIGFLGLHIGSMGHVRPRSGTLRPSSAPKKKTVKSLLGFNLIFSEYPKNSQISTRPRSRTFSAPTICLASVSVCLSSVKPSSDPNCPLRTRSAQIGSVKPVSARSALIGPELPSSVRSTPPSQICSSSESDLLRLGLICSILASNLLRLDLIWSFSVQICSASAPIYPAFTRLAPPLLGINLLRHTSIWSSTTPLSSFEPDLLGISKNGQVSPRLRSDLSQLHQATPVKAHELFL